MDDLRGTLLQHLSGTPFACSSIEVHPGCGTTNFVFRGILSESQEGGRITTVIFKHSTAYAAVNKAFPIDVSRARFEEFMLGALANAPDFGTNIKIPRLLMFDQERNTQVLEEYPGTEDLTSFLRARSSRDDASRKSLASSIGRRLGLWLRTFHNWASSPSQADLRGFITNDSMRDLKQRISYGSFLRVLETSCPSLLLGTRERLEKVRDMASKEFYLPAGDDGGSNWGLIHGDFWSGNILVPADPDANGDAMQLVVIDWEHAQIGHRAIDLGQMIGDLLERDHYEDASMAMDVLRGFIQGYGPIDDDLAFRTAIYTGVHLICWKTRGSPVSTKEEEGMKLGQDLILKGWEKDRQWLAGSVLAFFFKPSSLYSE